MTFEQWLSSIPIRQTPNGACLDLRIYIYPDGHGNFSVEDEQGRVYAPAQPVNNPAEAKAVLERVWNRAMAFPEANQIESNDRTAIETTLADQFSDVIGSAADLPEDMAENHDHYIHGTPKS